MALNIPIPGLPGDSLLKGAQVGSNLYANIMNPILMREANAQKKKQFEEEMKLRQAQFARSGANMDLQRALLQQQLIKAQHGNDPMYEFNQFKTLQDMMMGSGGQEQDGKGINLDALRQNPMLRGFFKHKFGYDPLNMPQTPEEKAAMALDLFKQKESIKAANKSGDTATNKVLTQNQQSVQAIDTVVPMIEEFINNPNLVYGATDFSPSKKAAYEAKTGGMIDMLVAAQSLPQVKESVKLVEDQIRRRTNESTDAYIKRLKDFKKDLMARRTKSASVVNSKKVNTAPSEDFTTMSDDELRKIAGGG